MLLTKHKADVSGRQGYALRLGMAPASGLVERGRFSEADASEWVG